MNLLYLENLIDIVEMLEIVIIKIVKYLIMVNY